MFELGFGEMLLTAVVALLVLGPKRLPLAARTLGLWARRARASWFSLRAELERELADDDIKASLREAREEMRQLKQELQAPLLTRTDMGLVADAPPVVAAISAPAENQAPQEAQPASLSPTTAQS